MAKYAVPLVFYMAALLAASTTAQSEVFRMFFRYGFGHGKIGDPTGLPSKDDVEGLICATSDFLSISMQNYTHNPAVRVTATEIDWGFDDWIYNGSEPGAPRNVPVVVNFTTVLSTIDESVVPSHQDFWEATKYFDYFHYMANYVWKIPERNFFLDTKGMWYQPFIQSSVSGMLSESPLCPGIPGSPSAGRVSTVQPLSGPTNSPIASPEAPTTTNLETIPTTPSPTENSTPEPSQSPITPGPTEVKATNAPVTLSIGGNVPDAGETPDPSDTETTSAPDTPKPTAVSGFGTPAPAPTETVVSETPAPTNAAETVAPETPAPTEAATTDPPVTPSPTDAVDTPVPTAVEITDSPVETPAPTEAPMNSQPPVIPSPTDTLETPVPTTIETPTSTDAPVVTPAEAPMDSQPTERPLASIPGDPFAMVGGQTRPQAQSEPNRVTNLEPTATTDLTEAAGTPQPTDTPSSPGPIAVRPTGVVFPVPAVNDEDRTVAPTTPEEEMVYFRMEIGFFDGLAREPAMDDVVGMICQTNNFFTKSFQDELNDREVYSYATNIDWNYDSSEELPFSVFFTSHTIDGQGNPVPAKQVYDFILGKANIQSLVADYIQISEPYTQNVFYDTEDLGLAGKYSGSTEPRKRMPSITAGKLARATCPT